MTWTLETSKGYESAKIAAHVVRYMQGRSLDIGCGLNKVWPSAIGIDSGHHFGKGGADIQSDGTDLSLFANESVDCVFSSHTLEHFPRDRVPAILAEWARVIKIGGYLVLYLPSANLYPKIGEAGANPDHKWDIYPGDVEAILDRGIPDKTTGYHWCTWTQVEKEERAEFDEYSLFLVFRKEDPHEYLTSHLKEDIWQRNPDGKKRALLIRYGAIGDIVQSVSVCPELRKQGYHVTVNCKDTSHEIIRHDPNIDDFILQVNDFVPNHELGPYWEALSQRYDLVINHCESIEASLLTLPSRLTHKYPDDARRRLFGFVNYQERLHDIACVPHDFHVKFYPTPAERAWAAKTKLNMAHGEPVIAWCINGSALHKVYPWTQVVVRWLLERTPCHVVLLADSGIGVGLQDGIVEAVTRDHGETDRLHPMAGKWSIRESLSFLRDVTCLVGPETGPLNAMSMEWEPAKVIYLSHSSKTNLTKHWRNTITLEPDRERAPCYPCHRLHTTGWEFCHQNEQTQAALCASAVSPESVFKAIALSLGAKIAA